MNSKNQAYLIDYDLTNCDSEPIHLIRLVQNHACLLACKLPSLDIVQVSDNTEKIIGYPVPNLLQENLHQIVDSETMTFIQEGLESPNGFKAINPIRTHISKIDEAIFHNIIAHVNEDGLLLLEIEPISDNISNSNFQFLLSNSITIVQQASKDDLFELTAKEIKKITAYDRVMIYQFDEAYNGEVIAEVKEPHLAPFLGLKYPASDIPKQARALFLKNQVRILGDVKSEPAVVVPSINPITKQPLDLTHSVARGVSPIHLEYLTNIGVNATLSIAIIINDELWGLIACHHDSPKYLDYSLRVTCQFISQLFSGHLTLRSANDFQKAVIESNIIRKSLFEQMNASDDIISGLTEGKNSLMDLIDCSGALVYTEDKMGTIGLTPNEETIKHLVEWLDKKTTGGLFITHELPNIYPPAIEYKDKVAGLIALRFATNPSEFLIWFRPETIQEITWGGNPKKITIESEKGIRLSPRKSFAKWKETVHNKARLWQQYEKDAAIALRNDIKEFIIQKFNELKQLNKKLQTAYEDLESFSYSVSHDLRAPLRSIDGFAQILKEDYSEQLDNYGVGVLNTIINSSNKMDSLIDDILGFSRLGRIGIIHNLLDTNDVFKNILSVLTADKRYQKAKVIIAENLPFIYGDETLMNQLFTNIIGNALKYSSKKEHPLIEITAKEEEQFTIIMVKDNGIGIDMKYAKTIFSVFNRLVNEDDFEGTGVGLAIVHRVVERHDGEVWMESKIGVGTTFYVKLPKKSLSYSNER